ncbi:glycosyl hydrolase family 16 [Changchengzhania lutea]|uniref:glycosyl hydrolase family 16 n=1 Tax=Changchengzhania lutea TaxID=2049305 RepID=UPI00115ECD34|nr:glycosyl hydrolase family 16 [Changchengzhania lutea]
MKNIKFTYTKMIFLLGCIFTMVVGCERELSDEAVFATFGNTAEIFTDDPVGLTDQFFVSFDPATGANVDGFGVDDNVSYEGNSSIRIDVPSSVDPVGTYIGGIFRDRGEGRDLTSYNALTFWAKGSTTATVGEVGFGTTFGDDFPEGVVEDKYAALTQNIQLSTDWKKYIIPIPDASKLLKEKGMFLFSAGSQSTGGMGYTFWIDELKFEKVGSVSQPRPIILGGEDAVLQTFTGSEIDLSASGLQPKYNVDGRDIIVTAAPGYFNFISSNTDVAIVDEKGIISINGVGTTEITAELAGIKAQGTLTITSSGALAIAPVPTRPAANVKSIYSDAYTSVTESSFNPGFGGSTTQTADIGPTGQKVKLYTNNNFTGIVFNNTVDASTLTHLHIDIYSEKVGTSINIQIRDVGANGEIETNVFTGNPDGDDKDKRFDATGLTVGSWTSIDIPLNAGLDTQKNNLGAIILAGGPDFILDNIYFYKE